jgi:hypothetical protein
LDSSINIYWIYKFTIFITFKDRDNTTEQVWGAKRVFCMFRKLDDTIEQVWETKRAICEFRDRNDTNEQVWGPKQLIYEFKDRDNGDESLRTAVDFTPKNAILKSQRRGIQTCDFRAWISCSKTVRICKKFSDRITLLVCHVWKKRRHDDNGAKPHSQPANIRIYYPCP